VKARPLLAILSFHKIGPPPPGGWESWFYIPAEVFVSQLEYLRYNEWQMIDVETFLSGLNRPETLPPKSALLTFDDGYRSFLNVALPCLRKFGFPAVIFVPTAYIGGVNAFDANEEPLEEICDWDELRELEQQGISVQSHGVAHRRLSELDVQQQRKEIFESKQVLEEILGKRVDLFSFAYGDGGANSAEVDQLLKQAGYRASFLYGGGSFFLPSASRYRLPRLAMGPDTSLRDELGELHQ
jgi:peptidoglycan/xylan/chitin deacetylase (PgdA/CDA1 family)